MARAKKEETLKRKNDHISEILSKTIDDPIQSMPLETYGQYMEYNEAARKANKKYGYYRYEIKPCPIELHPMERVQFSRNDQPGNPLPVFLRNHKIEFEKVLIPGKTYDLPRCVIEHLSTRAVPKWKWFDNPDGTKETRIASYDRRFSLRTIYKD